MRSQGKPLPPKLEKRTGWIQKGTTYWSRNTQVNTFAGTNAGEGKPIVIEESLEAQMGQVCGQNKQTNKR